MSPGVVLDASVAVKLVLEEAYSQQAEALYQQTLLARQLVVAPPLLRAEVGNAIYQQQRRGTISPEEAEDALQRFLALSIEPQEPDGLYTHAYALALQLSLPSLYDATYVALAQALGLELWTADERLLNTLGTQAPWVRSIADYPLPDAGDAQPEAETAGEADPNTET
jgi:predicted nucleic acid-binding protein